MGCRDGTPGILTDLQLLQEQELLGEAYSSLVSVEGYVQSGLQIIVLSTDDDVEVSLLQPFAQNLITVDHNKTSVILRQATQALEQHIVDRSGQTFDDYLSTHALKVSQDFAALSASLGLSIISPTNIA